MSIGRGYFLRSLFPKLCTSEGSHNTGANAISRLDVVLVQDEKGQLDKVDEVLVPIYHAFSYRREHTYSPTPNKHGVRQSQQRRCDLPFHSKKKLHKPRVRCSPEKLSKNRQYSTQFVEDTQVLCKDGKIDIPNVLQRRAVSWYYHYLQHPGHTCFEETLHAAMYWAGLIHNI
jgi:hypothetical protein